MAVGAITRLQGLFRQHVDEMSAFLQIDSSAYFPNENIYYSSCRYPLLQPCAVVNVHAFFIRL